MTTIRAFFVQIKALFQFLKKGRGELPPLATRLEWNEKVERLVTTLMNYAANNMCLINTSMSTKIRHLNRRNIHLSKKEII